MSNDNKNLRFWQKETAREAFLRGWAAHNKRGRTTTELTGIHLSTAEGVFERWWEANYE